MRGSLVISRILSIRRDCDRFAYNIRTLHARTSVELLKGKRIQRRSARAEPAGSYPVPRDGAISRTTWKGLFSTKMGSRKVCLMRGAARGTLRRDIEERMRIAYQGHSQTVTSAPDMVRYYAALKAPGASRAMSRSQPYRVIRYLCGNQHPGVCQVMASAATLETLRRYYSIKQQ
nr:hypothetical protein Iba_chr14aCG5660 [Ipomoea batatas]